MYDIDKEQYCELMLSLEVQQRLRKNLVHLMREKCLASGGYEDQCAKLGGFLRIDFWYAEQAIHGRPVYRDFVKICNAFHVGVYDMIFSDITAGEAAMTA